MSSYFIHNGPIHTMSEDGIVRAMLVVGDKVRCIGSEDEVRKHLPWNVREIDLKGRAVFPGFHDCHHHFLMYAVGLKRVNLMGVPTVEEGLEIIRKAADAAKSRGEWIVGGGWDKSLWIEFPNRHQLDSVTNGVPTCLSSKDGHSTWVNSKALELSGVTRSTEAPAGGAILKDELGEPTGILQDTAAGLVRRHVPKPSPEFVYEAAAACIPHLWKMGITCVHAPDSIDLFGIARRLRLERDLPIRFAFMPPVSEVPYLESMGIQQGYGDDWVWTAQIKMFKDGSLGSSTAYLYEPYEGMPDYFGLEVMTDEELRMHVRASVEAGYGVAVHAIGDKAVAVTLDGIEASLKESRRRGIRHRIEHAQMIHPDDISRFRELGVVASVQPAHAVADRYMADREWADRSVRAYPFGQLVSAGAMLAFGSDAPVDTPDPLYGIHCAVNRNLPGEPEEKEWHPAEKTTVETAVTAYTRNAAFAACKENVIGDLTPGRYGDFVVLSKDIMDLPASDITSAEVQAVSIGGQFVVPPEWC